jgi:hypothetical protein
MGVKAGVKAGVSATVLVTVTVEGEMPVGLAPAPCAPTTLPEQNSVNSNSSNGIQPYGPYCRSGQRAFQRIFVFISFSPWRETVQGIDIATATSGVFPGLDARRENHRGTNAWCPGVQDGIRLHSRTAVAVSGTGCEGC